MGILIKNGTVVSADKTIAADVLVEAGTIKEVRPGISAEPGHEVLDATGMLLLPGGIDAHTHLDMPFGGTTSSDDFETGTRAAAIGGTTTLIDFAIQARGTKMRDALDTWWKKAESKAFMAYPNVLMVDDATIFRALQQTSKNGALICMHAENGSVIDILVRQALAERHTAPIHHALTRPALVEAEAVHRAIALAEMAGVP